MENIHEISTNKVRAIPWFFLVMLITLLSTAVLLTAIPRTWAAEDTLEVYQQAGHKVFGQNTSLDIFNEYAGDDLEGEKLIDPYSEGTYVFAVYNNSNGDSMPYALEIEAVNPGNVPIVISFEKNGEYIYGGNGEANMLPFSMLQFEYMLDGNKTDIYTLRWAWSSGSDTVDTKIGTSGTTHYTLIITAKGTLDETEVTPPKSGDLSNSTVWIAVMFTSALILFIVFVRRKKSQNDNVETSFEDV